MCQFLPYKNLKFVDDAPLLRILETPDDSEIGYITECDLHFPRRLHDKCKELPPAQEALAPRMV